MDFDKRTVTAFLLIGMILLFMNTETYQKWVDPKGYEQRKAITTRQTENVQKESVSQADEMEESYETPLLSENEEGEERLIIVETDEYKATLSTRGAGILQWELKKYVGANGHPVKIMPENAYGTLAVVFTSKEDELVNTGAWFFDYHGPDYVKVENDSTTIVFFKKLEENRAVIKKYSFYPKAYDIKLNIEFRNLNDVIAGKRYVLEAPNGLAPTEKIIKDDMFYAKAGTSARGVVDKSFKTNGKERKVTAEFDWVAVRTKYFAFFILPDVKSIDAEIVGQEIDLGRKDKWKKYSLRVSFPYWGEANQSDTFRLYLGPLEYDLLKSYHKNMEDFMDMGWKIIKPFSIAILFIFKWMHNFIPNYGVVLLIFALMIKVITYPLTQKSNKSMQKMQSLQPKLKELQEKYKNDAAKLNQATMKLYKEEGINPMSGCFPMLLQMPLLFALFIVFRTTIELRSQGFIWWIKDLSAPDTIFTFPGNFSLPLYGNTVNVLPIIMGLTMYFQQKMTVTDPSQKFMIYFMPIFFALLFNSFPSGLNLYYALFNILSIVQQKYFTPKLVPESPGPIKTAKPLKQGRRK